MTTTGGTDRKAVLDGERAINEHYLREIDELLRKQPDLIKQISVIQSQNWTRTALPRPGIDAHAVSAIIGRVALEEGHPYSDLLPDSVYIAGWRIETEDFQTVNWAAPIASIFFEGRASTYELAPSVLGRRTFVLRLDDLVDFHDEIETPGLAPFERAARVLDVPAAPTRRRRPAQAAGPSEPVPVEAVEAPQSPSVTKTHHGFGVSPEPIVADDEPALEERVAGLRAASAVLKVMQMPKTGRMGAILPTMQPEQYRLVSWPSTKPLIVQGQPGTGKTVIAAHRAVFLTSEERESKRIPRIAIVGPSDHYVDHVAPIVSELKERGAEIRLYSLPALLQNIVGLRARPKSGPIGLIESSWGLGRAIDDVVRTMPSRPASGPIDRRVRSVVEWFRTADLSDLVDAEIGSWLGRLPSWAEVSTQIRYLPMLAAIALALNPRAVGEWVGHLIVDEAQDVRPLEWRILTQSLLEAGGGLTLLGDMNQRRSDWTAPSWLELARDLELTEEDGTSTVEEIDNGYRSTRQILRFANQLLPRGARAQRALRDGPAPLIRKVPEGQRMPAAVDAAIGLSSRHEGMVAIVSTDLAPFSQEFRRRNWVRGRFQHSWALDDRMIVLLEPDEARGLEFDGVVVVEPGAFPVNVGRQGVLYTSLTRANKELAVIHSAALPKELRVKS